MLLFSFCNGSSVREIFLVSLLNLVFSMFKRAWGFLGGMECGQYMYWCFSSVPICMLFSEGLTWKKGSDHQSWFPHSQETLHFLWASFCKRHVDDVLSLSFLQPIAMSSNLQRYFPCFPSHGTKIKITGSELLPSTALSLSVELPTELFTEPSQKHQESLCP